VALFTFAYVLAICLACEANADFITRDNDFGVMLAAAIAVVVFSPAWIAGAIVLFLLKRSYLVRSSLAVAFGAAAGASVHAFLLMSGSPAFQEFARRGGNFTVIAVLAALFIIAGIVFRTAHAVQHREPVGELQQMPTLPTAQRLRGNLPAWLALSASFFLTLAYSAGFVQFTAAGLNPFPAILAVSLVSALVFGVCSAGILLRHHRVALRWPFSLGAALALITYVATCGIGQVADPGFRYTAQFELLPMFLFPSLFGVLVGVGFTSRRSHGQPTRCTTR